MAGPWNSQRLPVHGSGYDTQSGGSIHLQGVFHSGDGSYDTGLPAWLPACPGHEEIR